MNGKRIFNPVFHKIFPVLIWLSRWLYPRATKQKLPESNIDSFRVWLCNRLFALWETQHCSLT